MNQTRAEEYRSPLWQKKRLEILNQREWRCQDCDSATQQLHVHHTYYVPTRAPWEYPDFAFVVVCDRCHSKRHEQRDENDITGVSDRLAWETFFDVCGVSSLEACFGLVIAAIRLRKRGAQNIETTLLNALIEEEIRLAETDCEAANVHQDLQKERES